MGPVLQDHHEAVPLTGTEVVEPDGKVGAITPTNTEPTSRQPEVSSWLSNRGGSSQGCIERVSEGDDAIVVPASDLRSDAIEFLMLEDTESVT